MKESKSQIPYADPCEIFEELYDKKSPSFIFESRDISPIYGRFSLIGIDPILKITGKNNDFAVAAIHERGKPYIDKLNSEKSLRDYDEIHTSEKNITGKIIHQYGDLEETKRSKQKNISQIIRSVLNKFHRKEPSFLGLYGAFSYDFIRLFEDIDSSLPENDINDFTFYLYDTFVLFDHMKEKTEIIVFRSSKTKNSEAIREIKVKIEKKQVSRPKKKSYTIASPRFDLNQKEYENLVKVAKKYAKKGDIFEVVFFNTLKAKFTGDPLELYKIYREKNPSPYLFYMNLQEEQLVGASPEMMVRCENNKVHLRPISGTARRGKDPIEDYENMLSLLNDSKEKAELDMLIDLGRNDLSRTCEPGITIKDYRYVEKYSKVMHTIAHLTGTLREKYTALDALISCLNAGTLTGAPKIQAMKIIEKHEKERRGYYGGTIGYLTFSGEMDTAIIIRTAHIRGNQLRFQVGATLLYDSNPKKEYEETLSKASAFLHIIGHQPYSEK